MFTFSDISFAEYDPAELGQKTEELGRQYAHCVFAERSLEAEVQRIRIKKELEYLSSKDPDTGKTYAVSKAERLARMDKEVLNTKAACRAAAQDTLNAYAAVEAMKVYSDSSRSKLAFDRTAMAMV